MALVAEMKLRGKIELSKKTPHRHRDANLKKENFMLDDQQIEFLRKSLPPLIGRSEVARFAPGLITARSLANLDCQGKGPRRVSIGRKVGYTRQDFIDWIISREKETCKQ